MNLDPIYAGDSLEMTIIVKNDDGNSQDLTDATVEAAARRFGTVVNADSVTIQDATAGEILVFFSPGTLTEGTWDIQTRVTIDSNVQTVSKVTISVKDSVFDD